MPRRFTGFWQQRRQGSEGTFVAPPPVFLARPLLQPIDYVVYIGDRRGTVIGELAGHLESVTWSTDGYGMASMILPLRDAFAAGPLLEFGNRVYIELSGGLQPWGGVVDVPRETTLGQMRLQFYEAAYTLNWRLTPRMAMYSGSEAAPAASILADLVGRADLVAGIDISAAAGGQPVDVEFHLDTLATAGQRLRDVDPELHYFIRPYPRRAAGGIYFELVAFRGALADRTDTAVLIQGYNLIDWTVLEQGPIYNEVTVGVGDFIDPPEGSYAELFTAGDAAGQARHGLRQQLISLPEEDGEAGPGRAENRAAAQLERYSRPSRRVRGACLNLPPALYGDYGIGSRMLIEATSPMAAAEEVTVIGMELQPATGLLSLTFNDDTGEGL
jgi:hypothetical protein